MIHVRWPLVALALAAAIAACSADEPAAPPDVDAPGFGGSGGTDGDAACDRDGDGEKSTSCAGTDCNDRNPDVNSKAPEVCEGSTDENCDGTVDEGCACLPGEVRPCYPLGDAHPTRNVGACADGLQRCGADGAWGACEDAVAPADEGTDCDGIDQDCDGVADGDLRNACGTCGETPVEVCGNGLDDDCDGTIDDPERCSVQCDGIDFEDPQPAALACCVQTFDGASSSAQPSRTTFACVEWPGLPACAERPCLDLDGDPATVCASACSAAGCVCGEARPGREPVASAGCGFESPCALQDCAGRLDQPCYGGPPGTLGVGVCRGGVASCVDGDAGRAWSSCVGEVLPGVEICGNGLDDDCDGEIDEADGITGVRCPGLACRPDAVERCGNGLDDDCDGYPDDGCPATAESQACYGGPLGTRGVGICRDGTQQAIDGRWGPCVGEVQPAPERCGDGVDSDCNGLGGGGTEDPGCCVPAGPEVCNGVDDDCDGLVDEGVTNACGRCDDRCHVTVLADPADCNAADRTCEHVVRDPLDPAALTVGDGKAPEPTSFFVLRQSEPGATPRVARVSTEDGSTLWETPLGSERVATDVVASGDGSVWVVASTATVQAYHLGADGTLLCATVLPERAQYAAVDGAGRLWGVSGNLPLRFFRVDAHAIRPPPLGGGIAQCLVHDLTPEENTTLAAPVQPIGRALWAQALDVTPGGVVWAATNPITRWADGAATSIDIGEVSPRGLALDREGGAWVTGTKLTWIDPTGSTFVFHATPPAGTRFADVLVARSGVVWVYASRFLVGGIPGLLRYEPAAGTGEFFALPGAESVGTAGGLAEDSRGGIWLRIDGALYRFDPAGETWTSGTPTTETLVLPSHKVSAVGRETLATGTWRQVIDGGWHDIDWARLDWEGSVPEGTVVEARLRFAHTRDGLAAAPACGPFTEAPIDLHTCVSAGRRFLEIELFLREGASGERPSIRNLAVDWSRP